MEPGARTIALSSLVSFLIFLSTATSSASCSSASRRLVLPARSRGRTEARIPLACKAVMSFLALPRGQLGQQPLQPVDRLDPLPGQLLAPVGEHPQRLVARRRRTTPASPLVRTATTATACAS